MFKLKNAVLLIGLLHFLFACENDNNTKFIAGTNSIVNFLENDPEFSLFSKAVKEADLPYDLDGNFGDYTILAPDDEAMQVFLKESSYASIDEFPDEEINRLVGYHIFKSLISSEDFTTGYEETLSAIPLNDSISKKLNLYVFKTLDQIEFNATSKITEADIDLDNGVLHKVDEVLNLPTVETFLKADKNLNPFYKKIKANERSTDLLEWFSDAETQITLLAPGENAVLNFFEHKDKWNEEELNQLYRYHVLDELYLTEQLDSGTVKTKALKDGKALQMPVNRNNELTFNNGVPAVSQDLMAINGVIHLMEEVLVPGMN